MDIYTVTKPNTVSDPSYSPDGEKIVFVEKIGSTYKISTVDLLATSTHTVLQSGALPYADPFYSPDGNFILFAVQTVDTPPPHGTWALMYMNKDGTGLTTILDDGNANMHPCWMTPTQIGFQYVFNGSTPGTTFQIALIDLAGQGRMELGEGEYPRGIVI